MKPATFQTSLRRVIVVVACGGVIAWAYRRIEDSRRTPSTLDWVHTLRTGGDDARKLAADRLATARAVDAGYVIPALVGALSDGAATIRLEAVLALGQYLASTVPVLGDQILQETGIAGVKLVELIKTDPDSSVRSQAARALGSLLRGLAEATIPLEKLPSDTPIDRAAVVAAVDSALQKDPASRQALMAAFLDLGPTDLAAPPNLVAALKDTSKSIRLQAMRALTQFGSGVDEAVPVLLGDLAAEGDTPERRDIGTSGTAHRYLSVSERLRPSPAVLPALIKALESENRNIRGAAALILAEMGPAARPAAGALAAAARKWIPTSAHAQLRADALFSDFAPALIRVLPPDEAVAILCDALRPAGYWSRSAAASALARLGSKAQAALPALINAMEEAAAQEASGDSGYAVAVVEALSEIATPLRLPSEESDKIVTALAAGLEFKDPLIRGESAEALEKLGPLAAAALPRLKAIAKEETKFSTVRDAAAKAAATIAGARQLVP
jgi:HEAT repeat protein